MAVHGCVGVDIRNLEIIAPGESPNTDGISIFESQHVEVTDCNIGTGKIPRHFDRTCIQICAK